jgi:hypothetical protein
MTELAFAANPVALRRSGRGSNTSIDAESIDANDVLDGTSLDPRECVRPDEGSLTEKDLTPKVGWSVPGNMFPASPRGSGQAHQV